MFTSEQLENLKLLKYMKQPFQTRIVSKLKKPSKLTCPRCIRLHKRGDQRDKEHEFPIKGHTCDGGCNYIAYDCFTNLEFADTDKLHRFCPMAEVLQRVLASGEEFAANLSKVDMMSSCNPYSKSLTKTLAVICIGFTKTIPSMIPLL